MKILKKLLVFILVITMLVPSTVSQAADTASKYITVEEFAETLAKELNIKEVEGDQASGYVNALLEKGIIVEKQFSSYDKNITRTDALIMINLADEYLHGDNVDLNLVDLVIKKRISDIKKIKDWKREYVAKAYIKGFMAGYKTEDFGESREMRGGKKITRDGASNVISMLNNKSKRGKVTKDGQLIQTTNLPKNADKFPYILANYPNKYYAWELKYHFITKHEAIHDFKEMPLEKNVDYFDPVDVDKCPMFKGNFVAQKEQYLGEWVEKVRTYMYTAFNVNYKTVDDGWIQTIKETSMYNGMRGEELFDERMKEYINDMKENKTIIKCSKVEVDGSSLYYCRYQLYLRVYVRYKIVSSATDGNYTSVEIVDLDPHKGWIFDNGGGVDFRGTKIGTWVEDCFDIPLGYVSGGGENMGVSNPRISPGYYRDNKVR